MLSLQVHKERKIITQEMSETEKKNSDWGKFLRRARYLLQLCFVYTPVGYSRNQQDDRVSIMPLICVLPNCRTNESNRNES